MSMKILFGINLKDTKTLEARLREHSGDPDFCDVFEAVWTYLSDDFIIEFAEDFKKLDLWSSPACYKMSKKIFYEMFGKNYD